LSLTTLLPEAVIKGRTRLKHPDGIPVAGGVEGQHPGKADRGRGVVDAGFEGLADQVCRDRSGRPLPGGLGVRRDEISLRALRDAVPGVVGGAQSQA